MPTLILVSSTQIFELLYRLANFECYSLPNDVNLDGKPIYYNKNNLPLDKIIDQRTGEPINPEEVTIIYGDKDEDPTESGLTVLNYVKKIFCQWVEIAAYNSNERKEHISDYVWERMSVTPNSGEPAPITTRGAPQTIFAEKAEFRMVSCPLLTDHKKWYVLYDSGPDK